MISLCCFLLYLPYAVCNHLLWSDRLDETNNGNWIINGSVHEIHSHRCPTTMDCWELAASTDSKGSAMAISISTQHYLNFTLSFGITIFDKLSLLSTSQNLSFSHRNYCRIYYKTNTSNLLTSYFFNTTDPFANKLPLQSYTLLPNEYYETIEIRFVNIANDAQPFMSCYIDEISLTAEYYLAPSQSSAMNTILVVVIIVSTSSVLICLIICAILAYLRFVKIEINKATLANIQTVKSSNSEIQTSHLDSISCKVFNAAPSPTATLNGSTVPITSNTPSAIPLQSTIKPNDDGHNTVEDAIQTALQPVALQNDATASKTATTNQLTTIMQEVLSSPSNNSSNDNIKDVNLTSYDLYDEKHKTMSEAMDIDISNNASFESYKEHNEQNSLSFADESLINIRNTRLSSKPEEIMYKRSGASSMRSSTKAETIPSESNVQSNENNDSGVFYSYDAAFSDEKSDTIKKVVRKYTQDREEESLDIGSGTFRTSVYSNIYLNEISQDLNKLRKSKSATQMSHESNQL